MAAGAAADADDLEFPPFLGTAPIFFISTHGAYNLNKDTRPFLVPENTIIIETVDIGELCLTSIDSPLWNLMQGSNRAKLVRYMKGIPDPTDSKEDQEKYLRIFNNVRVYFPGSPIYSRVLNIGPEKRKDYKNMGFFKFPVGAPSNTFNNSHELFVPSGDMSKILRPLERQLVLDGNALINYEFVLGSSFPELIEPARIFIFSSCGSIWLGSSKQIEYVQRVQEEARLRFMAMRQETESVARNLTGTRWSRRKGLRSGVTEEFATGAFTSNNATNQDAFYQAWSKAALEPTGRTSAARTNSRPIGEQLFYKIPDTQQYKQLHKQNMSLYYTPAEVKLMKQQTPDKHLYKLVNGDFVALKGGYTRRNTRRNLKRSKLS